MDERFVKKLYCKYDVDRGLSEIDYIQLVKDSYIELTRVASEGNLVIPWGRETRFGYMRYKKSTSSGKNRLQIGGMGENANTFHCR